MRFTLCGLMAAAAVCLAADNSSWLVRGPFPANGENALFRDYLEASGGEASARPCNATHEWRMVASDADASVDLEKIWSIHGPSVAYAYRAVESDSERLLAVTLGSGSYVQVRWNGEIVFESRLSRKVESDRDTLVVRAKRGTNHLLLKIEGRPKSWAFQWREHPGGGALFVNRAATMVPDLREGQRTDAWGQVEMANTAARTLKARVEVAGGGTFPPTVSEPVDIPSGAVRRIPFRVAARGATPRMRALVRAGGEEVALDLAPLPRKRGEYFVTTYRSRVDGSVQPYSVLLPTDYQPTRRYPLIIELHGAHVTGWGQNMISYEPKSWAIHMAPHDRGNNRYRDIGEVDLDEALDSFARDFPFDPDRVYLSGHSMGGYGTWLLACRHPDRWASISPQAGYTDYHLYRPGKFDPRYQTRLYEDWSPVTLAENLLHVPAHAVHGALDDDISVEHPRSMVARLNQLGYTVSYDEQPDKGHWWGPRGATYGTECVDKPSISAHFQKYSRRTTAPRKVIFKTATLRYRKSYWAAIDELATDNQMAMIEAESPELNRFLVKTVNIARFTLTPRQALLDNKRPVTVAVDGKAVYQGPLPATGRLAFRHTTKGWLRAEGVPKRSRFAKSETLYGPVIDAFTAPFLFVYGDGPEKAAAEAQARDWMARAWGIAPMKKDSEVTARDIATRNLALFGTPSSNKLIARIHARLPIQFTSERIRGEDAGVVMVAPNPLITSRYVVVVGGLTKASYLTAARLRLTDLPDYVIFDRHTLEDDKPKFVEAGFFSKHWTLSGE